MLNDALLAWFHHIAAFGLAAVLVVEMAVCKPGLTSQQMRTLSLYDALYGMFALLMLVAGFLRVYLGVKGAAFYWVNPMFHAKLTLFVAMGLLSVVPTIRYIRWRKAYAADPDFVPSGAEIRSTRMLLHIQATLLLFIPLLAALVARGIGAAR
jgi:putative membrane protein